MSILSRYDCVIIFWLRRCRQKWFCTTSRKYLSRERLKPSPLFLLGGQYSRSHTDQELSYGMAIYGKVIKLKEVGSLTPWRTDHTSSELTIFRFSKRERRIFCYTCLFWFNLKPNLSQYKAHLKKGLILAFNRVQVIVEELVLYGQVGLSPKLDGKYNVRISLNVYSLTKRLNSCSRFLSLQRK